MEKIGAETALFVKEALEVETENFAKLLKDSHEGLDERIRILEREADKRAGAKAALMFLAVIGGGIVSELLRMAAKTFLK